MEVMEALATIFSSVLVMAIILGVSALGLIAWTCGEIASSLGRDRVTWIIWGLIFNIFTLILVRFFLPPVGVTRRR
jgi:hypothetical protein